MYEAAFKNIDDTLRKDAGCSSELDYIEQTSWTLFLKYLDDYETEKQTDALLKGSRYRRIIDGKFRWSVWAAPKRDDGTLDYSTAITGDDLRDFVNDRLFPHLARFKQTAEHPRSITYKIGEIFGEVRNTLQSGYALRDVINKVDELDDGKLDIMLRAKYGSVDQAQKILGAPEDIRQTFIDSQRELYA